ncbi:MAG: glycosyl hydrolase [Deltaproteobacteria bacterium]|nr:glycosyl hydrolase [Deltaproteobacteria bacterium]MDQ3301152.1 alpha-amylase family glycosyl hydrolase [Myxococcota bacterium]
MKLRASFSLTVACLLASCALGRGGDSKGNDAGTPDGDPGVVPLRSCTTQFALQPTGVVTGVAVAGEWDWQAREPLADTDGDGTYTLDKELPAGLYAYKFVVTRPGGVVEWILDPGNPYRAYDAGVENSGMRVEDCGAPLVEVVSNEVMGSAALARLRLARGASGAAITELTAVRRHEGVETTVAVTRANGELAIELADLSPGKHTLVVDATAADGRTAARVLVPFWIEAQRFDWRDALIYMVMIDRFRNGDPSNDPAPSPGAERAADFHGGDLRGITAAIEDGTFDALGVRTLWLSPFVENAKVVHSEDGHGVTAYHGYWPIRARAIDPRLGTEADLDAMVTAAHRRGIRVLMDYVINHVHRDHEYATTHPEWLRTGCECGKPGCDWTERRLDCSFHDYMPDVDWQHRGASEQMIADALYWLERFDLDGLRVDAVKHVEDLAITNLSTRVHERFERGGTEYFLLGETAMGWRGDDLAANIPEYQTIARYVGEYALSGQFDFVLYHATASRVWADDAKGMLHLDYWTRQSIEQYPASAVMTPFVGSHDAERLISLADLGSGSALVHHKWADQGLPTAPVRDEPYDRAAIALAWTLTMPGAPLLYYGDEYGEHGGADPDNRHMWRPVAQRTPRQHALHARVARVGKLRQELAPLRRGAYVNLTVTEDVLSFARTYENQAVIVVINRAASPRVLAIDVPASVLADGALTDRMDPGGRSITLAGGRAMIEMAPRSTAILVP